MKNFLKTTAGKICIVIAAILLVGGIALGALAAWYYAQPKFQNVTMELGGEKPGMSQFLGEYAKAERSAFVTDMAALVLDKAGTYDVTLVHGRKEETVQLIVVDTTAPTASFQSLVVNANELPEAGDFVVEAQDLSELTFSFETALTVPDDYAQTPVSIVVADASGNTLIGNCTLNYIWMHQELVVALGEEVTPAHILFFPDKDADSLDKAQMDAVNAGKPGEFTVSSTIGGVTQTCKITVTDNVGPELVTKDVTILQGQTVEPMDFVETYSDYSTPVSFQFAEEPDTTVADTLLLQLIATDALGNTTTADVVLTIETDTEAPVFGEMETLYVEKGSSPDYKAGVTVTDNAMEAIDFTVDASAVDTSKGGTYYITYTATDLAGNETRYRRKVEVIHNQEDTQNLIKEMAERCARNYGTSVEDLRDFVRNSIGYSSGKSAWGGEDPIWYGFTQFTGNCYVHAVCLEALLEYYGYTYQEIWVTHIDDGRPSHYWVIVDMGGYWRHVDATPGVAHSKYSLMTDEQRYETLYRSDYGQRDWDRSLWPACE